MISATVDTGGNAILEYLRTVLVTRGYLLLPRLPKWKLYAIADTSN